MKKTGEIKMKMFRSADGDVLRLSIKLINNVGRKKRSNLKTELNYI